MGAGINTAIGPGKPLEIFRLFTPLAFRSGDLTLNLPVIDGLAVTLWPANNPGQPLPAVRTQSGIYTFFGIPGMRAVEYPGAEGFGPSRTFSYIVTVEDTLGRYLPVLLVYTLDQT